MAKDPAFLFYPGDFTTGTQFFSDEQVGKYMRLLLAQHQHGHLTDNQVIFICKSYDNHIMSKFSKDSAGLWYNERLEFEIIKRKNFTESRSINKAGKTKEKIISSSYDFHMENKNKDVIDNILIIGAEGKNSISIKAKYITEKAIRIYDLQEYFEWKGQLTELQQAGWTKFLPFMKANPAGVFEDANHLYRAFKKYSTNPSKQGVSSKLH